MLGWRRQTHEWVTYYRYVLTLFRQMEWPPHWIKFRNTLFLLFLGEAPHEESWLAGPCSSHKTAFLPSCYLAKENVDWLAFVVIRVVLKQGLRVQICWESEWKKAKVEWKKKAKVQGWRRIENPCKSWHQVRMWWEGWVQGKSACRRNNLYLPSP